jgi:hypothetical protein
MLLASANLQRETLCNLLNVPSTGTTQQKSRRLFSALKGPSRDTFLDLTVGSCPELASLTMAQAQNRLRTASFKWDPNDLAEAREACALREWLLNVCTTVNDLKALPSYLLDRVRMVRGVDRQWHTDVTATSSLRQSSRWSTYGAHLFLKFDRQRRLPRVVAAFETPEPETRQLPPARRRGTRQLLFDTTSRTALEKRNGLLQSVERPAGGCRFRIA